LVVNLAALFFLFVGAEISFGGWVHTYSTTLGLADETTASYLTSAFWGALTAGRLLGIPIAARARAETILIVDLVICVGSVVLILLVPGSSVVLWIGAMALGLGMASIFPTMIVLAESRMTVTGAVTGWFLVGSSAGGMTVPWLIGQLFESTGPRVTMLAILVDLVIAIFLWWVLTQHRDPVRSVAIAD
jgi:FHS family Na+ dependent glucose MFS transporter 1